MAEEVQQAEEAVKEPQVEETATQESPQQNPTDNPAPTEQVKGPTESLLEAEKKEGDADEQKPEGAPESYQPFDVDGQQFTQEQLEGFASTARELGLSQEKAQKMLSAMVPTARKYLVDDLVVKSKQWAEDTRNDPEIGGAHFNENLGIATAAYQRYATPELKAILTNSGLGNHPEVIRLFCRIGKETRQDTGVSGSASAPAEGRRRRYPNSNMVVDE